MIEGLIADIAAARAARADRTRRFDPVELLVTREADLSRLFAWMLDPHGTHGVGTRFLDLLLARLGLEAAGTGHIATETERPVGAGTNGGRVDILIRHDRWTIAIENKPWCGFGDRQIERYVKAIACAERDWRVVVLLGSGWPDDYPDTLRQTPNVDCLLLGHAGADWVAECAAAAGDAVVSDFLGHLHHYLKRQFGGGDLEDMREDVAVMVRSPDHVAAAIAVMEAEPEFLAAMNRGFALSVARRAAAEGLPLVTRADDPPLIGMVVEGMLRIDVGLDDYDFAVSAEKKKFGEVVFGFRLRCGSPALVGRGKVVRAYLEQKLGQSEGGNPYWPWWRPVARLDPSGARTTDRASLFAWAVEDGEQGLAAQLVRRAAEAKELIGDLPAA